MASPASHAFLQMISGPRPVVDADVTISRLDDSGAATVYLAPVTGVKLAGVDRMVAFLGGDTQSDPPVEPALYIYAQRGSGLLELHAPLGHCEFPVPEEYWESSWHGKPLRTEADHLAATNDYYRHACFTPRILARARAVGKHLAMVYALAR